ncbi:hypothetical protein QJS04_geneDACA006938 [Acorus gramineus]|uniref:Uncharacterized protein n=1 Tax=Acorus gramineus TaxID=55184 RepID=A0AAV9AX38_ACOGR|nr:hypothetical protein QJS04_geneDACA006938 [Acorus gramineus]
MASASKSVLARLRGLLKKPWEFTGPCSHPEYRDAVPLATEYRRRCPASQLPVVVPSSDPETVFDIKYYTRDSRRDRPPRRVTVLTKADVERAKAEKSFAAEDFPNVYLTEKIEEDENARGGGYQK